jgi:hypothetical protein
MEAVGKNQGGKRGSSGEETKEERGEAVGKKPRREEEN